MCACVCSWRMPVTAHLHYITFFHSSYFKLIFYLIIESIRILINHVKMYIILHCKYKANYKKIEWFTSIGDGSVSEIPFYNFKNQVKVIRIVKYQNQCCDFLFVLRLCNLISGDYFHILRKRFYISRYRRKRF